MNSHMSFILLVLHRAFLLGVRVVRSHYVKLLMAETRTSALNHLLQYHFTSTITDSMQQTTLARAIEYLSTTTLTGNPYELHIPMFICSVCVYVCIYVCMYLSLYLI